LLDGQRQNFKSRFLYFLRNLDFFFILNVMDKLREINWPVGMKFKVLSIDLHMTFSNILSNTLHTIEISISILESAELLHLGEIVTIITEKSWT